MQTNNFGVKVSRDDKAHSRKEAKARGLTTYISNTPCKAGHLGIRYTSTGACRACSLINSNKQSGLVADSDIAEKRRAIEEHQARKRDEYEF